MSQIRSADLLVTTALADPKTLDELKQKPEQTLQKLAAQITAQLPQPTTKANDAIWIVVVSAFAVVLLGAGAVLGIGVFVVDSGKNITKPETMLALFTSVVGFLAGLLAPSPVSNK